LKKGEVEMTSKFGGLLSVCLAFLIVLSFLGQTSAEPMYFGFESCAGWVNCSTESPNYTGICCRPCKAPDGRSIWDCRKVGVERQTLGESTEGRLPAGEATITGIVTKEGILRADRGAAYGVAGAKAAEMRQNVGKKIEVKGTVQEAEGQVTIEVDAYEVLGYGAAATEEASASCAGWLNCDSRAPTFTGTCCRQCSGETGAEFWDCKVHSEGEHFDLAEWTR
jgi:hypothetical protein